MQIDSLFLIYFLSVVFLPKSGPFGCLLRATNAWLHTFLQKSFMSFFGLNMLWGPPHPHTYEWRFEWKMVWSGRPLFLVHTLSCCWQTCRSLLPTFNHWSQSLRGITMTARISIDTYKVKKGETFYMLKKCKQKNSAVILFSLGLLCFKGNFKNCHLNTIKN